MRNLFCFYSLFILVSLAISCQKVETCYSCDRELDAFVKNNFEQLQHYTIEDMKILDPEKQRAIYRSFDKEKKQLFGKKSTKLYF